MAETDPRDSGSSISVPTPRSSLSPRTAPLASSARESGTVLGPWTLDAAHEPWYQSLVRQLRREKRLPPLEVTSKPVAVKEIWGAYDQHGRGLLSSAALHVLAVTLLFTLASSPRLERAALASIDLFIPVDVAQFLAALENERGGGSGGLNAPLPVSRGRLPRFDERQLAPPSLTKVENARLAVEPALLGPRDLQVATLNLEWFGDPLATPGPPSHGPGSGGGFGNRQGTGVGPGDGSGYGPDRGGVSGVYRTGNGVSEPVLLYRVDPAYSEQARKTRLQGIVILLIEVWPDGRAHNIRLERGLGLGLDERAVDAVEKWRFQPGVKDGKPVPVGARVEVRFRLL